MGNLITYRQYCDIVGTPTNTTDAALLQNYLIPAASAAVERFVDRGLGLANYVEWTNSPNNFGVYFPLQFPLVALYNVSRADAAFTVQNTSAAGVVIVVQADQLQVYNPLANTTTTYLYTTYTTLASLLAKLATDRPDLVTVAAVATSFATTLLRPATIPIAAGSLETVQGAITPMSGRIDQDRIVYGGQFATVFTTQDFPGYPDAPPYGYAGNVCLVYSAGYNPIPSDLVYTVACIIRDMLAIADGDMTTGMKSEKVAQYDYTVLAGVDLDALVYTKYAMALSQYRRIIL